MFVASASTAPSSKPFPCPGLCIHPLPCAPAMTHSFTYLFIPQMFREKLPYSRNWFRPWDYKRGQNRPDLCPHAINDLVQGSAHCGLWATSDPSPGFVGKVVLGYSRSRALWIVCGCFRQLAGLWRQSPHGHKANCVLPKFASPCSNGKNSPRPYHLNARNLV